MKPRHRARILVLQALYEADCAAHDIGQVLERLIEEATQPEGGEQPAHDSAKDAMLPEVGEQFARELAFGVSSHRDWLDTLIGRYAPEWPVDQIAIIDRNILRIAIYEILLGKETPVKVAINEAVELAKMFGSDSSGRFVNGVLGTLVAKEAVSGKR